MPVETNHAGYLETVSTYIHLNPARAGLIVIGKEPLKNYRWSSYPWYVKPVRSGPAWLERGRVMGALGLKPEERRGYEAYLEGRVLELGLNAGRAELEGQWKALRRGWYVGGESFGARLRATATQSQIHFVFRKVECDFMPGQKREPHKAVNPPSCDISSNKPYILVGLPTNREGGK